MLLIILLINSVSKATDNSDKNLKNSSSLYDSLSDKPIKTANFKSVSLIGKSNASPLSKYTG